MILFRVGQVHLRDMQRICTCYKCRVCAMAYDIFDYICNQVTWDALKAENAISNIESSWFIDHSVMSSTRI